MLDFSGSNTTSPRAFSSACPSPTFDAAVFYTEVLSVSTSIMELTEVPEDTSDTTNARMFRAGWNRLRIAHLATVDRIGFELFEFDGNSAPAKTRLREHGIVSLAIQDPDVEGLLAEDHSCWRQTTYARARVFPDKKTLPMVYVEDPFGIVFEIYSHSYELHLLAGALHLNDQTGTALFALPGTSSASTTMTSALAASDQAAFLANASIPSSR
jgi:hypothetical protein